MRRLFLLTAVLFTLTLSACGTRGPLTLPPPQTKTPLAVENSQAQRLPADLNTVKEAS